MARTVYRLPPLVVVQLERNIDGVKCKRPVQFPVSNMSFDTLLPARAKSSQYSLVAVVLHDGIGVRTGAY